MAPEQNQLPTPDIEPAAAVAEDTTGGYDAPAPSPEPHQHGDEQQEDGKPEPKVFTDDKRSAIFANARRARQEAMAGDYTGDLQDQTLNFGTPGAAKPAQAPEELQQLQQLQQQPAAPKPPSLNELPPEKLQERVRTIVDGAEVEITVEEAIRAYQKNAAADNRLATAQQILRAAQQFQRTAPGDAGTHEHTGQDFPIMGADAGQDRGNTSREPAPDTAALIEKIQLGDFNDAAQALEAFVQSALQKHQPPVDDHTRVLTVLEDRNAAESVRRFAEQYPAIAQSEVLQAETTRHLHRGMVEDLERAGYNRDQLRQLVTGPQDLVNLHKQARINRVPGVRNVDELLAAGYQGAMESLTQTVTGAQRTASPNQAVLQQRQQRKDALQTQPTARRMTAAEAASKATAVPINQSRQAAFDRMRQARGQG